MPSWLVEDPTAIYILLAVAAGALAAGWWNTRKRPYLLGLGGVIFVAILVALLDLWIVTDREQLARTVKALGRSVQALDIDGVFRHLSEDFEFDSTTKAAFHEAVRKSMRLYEVREMEIWDVEIVEASREARAGKVEFHAKVRGNWSGGQEFYLVRADFVLEPDGEWRMRRFTLHKPFADTHDPVSIPLPR